MMDLLSPGSVIADLVATNKKQVLQELARLSSPHVGQAEGQIFSVLLERERLGTTGVGHGIAIPHGRLAGLSRVAGLFARLSQPIDFEAIDDRPVDLCFLLLAPPDAGADHLRALARISRLLRDPLLCSALRSADDAAALYRLLTTPAIDANAA